MMDSNAEAPQSRRAKSSVSPAGNMGETAGLSFVDTMIGLVQPPSALEPAKTVPESRDPTGGAKLAPDQGIDDATKVTDSLATPSAVVPALPIAITPINPASPSTSAAAVAKQEGIGAAGQVPDAQSAAVTLALMGNAVPAEPVPGDAPDALVAQTGDASATFKTGDASALASASASASASATQSAEPALKPATDQTQTAQALAPKTQATVSQSLLAGLAALGQTQQPAADDKQMAQLVATATATAAATATATATVPTPVMAQVPQPSPQPTDSPTSQASAVFDLALAADPQGPGAARALEAQSSEARTPKTNVATGWLNTSTGFVASDDAGLQSAPSVAPVATANAQASVALVTGPLPAFSKPATKSEETKIAATDAAGMMAGSNGTADAAASASTDGTGVAAPDANPKPTVLQPHTVPMLAAAMMRRIQNGMKEFTLRLDPPELGRVDVRLTVGTDKKVRAVVSTDRPEALKDLALSARDLTRALQEAGLELEENGLSFSMNDQGSSPQNRDANQQQSARIKHSLDGYDTSEAATPEPAAPLSAHLSGPVERWQRARIAMTA
ncbi:flagellar hook-length control protein FliK [Aquidulcibacter sp.]|uniref:flagellar hook-length control protein FliK n=1 Tax=Aquidulcibacter sp. TaxID=2052990 RepID=UPI0025BED48C|nr:flagellar hook-length control protein FliK [Aquidulcibacter sp.]MCA3698128.1 flagellar hook-length control protein FliK [Aquidulcibacter sp.]